MQTIVDDALKDLDAFVFDPDMTYEEFAGRIGRGENEDGFETPPDNPDDYL